MFFENFASLVLGIFILFWIIVLSVMIFVAVCNWKLYEKAGKEGWKALIPIYNMVVLFEIIGYKWYYIAFMFLGAIPFIGQAALILFTISYNIKLAKAFGQEVGFGIGLALVNPIFTAIIAFSKDIKYIGPTVKGDIDIKDLF